MNNFTIRVWDRMTGKTANFTRETKMSIEETANFLEQAMFENEDKL